MKRPTTNLASFGVALFAAVVSFSVFVLAEIGLAAGNSFDEQKLVGTWGSPDRNSQVTYNADHTFVVRSRCEEGYVNTSKGSWRIIGDHLQSEFLWLFDAKSKKFKRQEIQTLWKRVTELTPHRLRLEGELGYVRLK